MSNLKRLKQALAALDRAGTAIDVYVAGLEYPVQEGAIKTLRRLVLKARAAELHALRVAHLAQPEAGAAIASALVAYAAPIMDAEGAIEWHAPKTTVSAPRSVCWALDPKPYWSRPVRLCRGGQVLWQG